MKKVTFILLLILCAVIVCSCGNEPTGTPIGTEDVAVTTGGAPETNVPETKPAQTTASVTTTAPVTTAPATTAPAVNKLVFGEKVTKIEDLEKLNATENRIAKVKAFLTQKGDELNALYGRNDNLYGEISSVVISGFEAWCEYTDKIIVKINVTSSKLDSLPVGSHTLFFNAEGALEKQNKTEGNIPTPNTDTEKFIYSYLREMSYEVLSRYDKDMTSHYALMIHNYYDLTHGHAGTKAEYTEYFKTLFGREPEIDLDNFFNFDEQGKATVKLARGVKVYCYDLVESGNDHVTVQYYADLGCLIKSYKVKYTFSHIDGKLVPLNYEIIEGENRPAPALITT